jgi:hypothetical protein
MLISEESGRRVHGTAMSSFEATKAADAKGCAYCHLFG